jgi:hypothetical protein
MPSLDNNENYSIPEKIKQIVREKQAMFVVLEELDRTGKLRKSKYKNRYNFTLDEEIMQEFRSYCVKNNMNMSGKIENMIKEYLKNQAKKN